MTNKKTFQRRRKALVLALALGIAGGASAQTNTAGAIVGRAAAGDTVTISNPANGFSRTITVDGNGSYRFSQLPTGQYQVSRNGGAPRSVTVSVGSASNIDFVTSSGDATTLDTVTVIGTGAVNPIDVSSVESTTILTAEQIEKIPVARDTTSVALLAPGTVRGDAAFGNLASFGGSSVAENQYYLNGFNITNTFRNLNFSNVPFEAISEQQVKTGGYGAEFGRSLGGVVNQITKRGSNEFHAGANVFYIPSSLTSDTKNTYYSNPLTPEDFGGLRSDNSHDSGWDVRANVWAGGALIKDRLFAYGLVSYNKNQALTFFNVDANAHINTVTKSPTWLLKMDWNITDNNTLELTAFSDEQKAYTDTYLNVPGSFDRTGYFGQSVNEQGGDNYVLKYTGYLTDNFTLSALYGHSKFSRGTYLVRPDGTRVFYDGDINNPVQPGCPIIVDARPSTRRAITGTYASTCNITGGTLNRIDSGDTRDQFRLDGEWQLGNHLVRFGYDSDDYESVAGVGLEGGVQWRYSTTSGGTDIVRAQYFNQGAVVKVKQHAFYIEDSWNITDNFIAYLGGRWDTFENINGNGDTYVKIDNQFGPRLGFSWDVFGDSTFKVFGNAGRYALPLTPSVAVRGASASLFSRQNFNFTSVDPVTGAPIGLTPRGPVTYLNAETGNPHIAETVASKNLKPMYQDEYILGFQKQLNENMSLGMRAIYRNLKAAIDDNCDYSAVLNSPGSGFTFDEDAGWWYDAQGNAPSLPNEGFPYCRMFNPGEDAVFVTDFLGDGNLKEVTVPGALLSPKAKRKYSALEFFMDGRWDKLFLQGSYTFAKSIGNTEGGVKSDIGQADTSVTQDFDYLALTVDTYGYLPNDRRHSLKLFGNYELTDEWSIGANLLVQSGRPLNCLGVLYPFNGNRYHPYGSSFMRCGTTEQGQQTNPDGTYVDGVVVQRFPRGTKGRLPWSSNIDLNVAYAPHWLKGLTLKLDVFNVLNSQKVTSVNEVAELFGSTTPGTSGAPNPTYLLPASFQAPRSVRLMVQYEF